jgi:NACalpha-BTF3-like transcription factor
MAEEKQIYTVDELEEMSRVDLRKLAVKTWGMDNKECSGTKSAALREFIVEQQEAYEGGDDPPAKSSKSKASSSKKTSSSKASSSKSSSSRSRPSAGKASPKAGARGGRGAKRAAPKDDDAPPAVDSNGLSERIDLIGKTIDENHEEVKEALASAGGDALEEIKETLENIRLSQYILHGLVADIYRNYYEPDDLDTRVDELEQEFNEPEGND